jgi:predicted dehydrogenase
MASLGVGIIGCGGIGKVHILGYKSMSSYYDLGSNRIELVKVCTAHEETARKAQEQHQFKFSCTDYHKLLTAKDIDIIDCTAPNYLHHNIVIDAIEAGKHVYCEKPLAMNAREAEDIVKRASASNVKCQIAFNYRFVPAIMRARQLIGQDRLGKILTFRAAYLHSGYIDPGRPMSWRLRKSQAGGGALFDLGSHVLDLVRYLLGECEAVLANNYTLIKRRPIEKEAKQTEEVDVDDLSILQLRLKNGAIGTVEASRVSTGSIDELKIEIQGDKGAVRFNLMDPNWLYFYDVMNKNEPLEGELGFKRIETLQHYPDSDLHACARASVGWLRFHIASQYSFIRAILEDLTPEPSFEDGLAVQRIMEAAYLSSEEKKWIDLTG